MKEADWCWESIDFKVGKGNRVLFWTDKWCGNEALSQSFPQLFTLAGHKNAKVCEVWDSSLGQGGWNLSLVRDFNDWEMDQIGDMLNLLKDFRISPEEDSVRWKWEGNGVFGAKGAYKRLCGSSAGVFPNRRIWLDKVPTKVFFFAWEASWGKILTLDKLQRRGGSFLIGAIYAAAERKMRTIFSYIVQWLKLFGRLPLPFSEFNGCSQNSLNALLSLHILFLVFYLIWTMSSMYCVLDRYYRMFEATQDGLGRNAPVHSIHGSLLAVGELLRLRGRGGVELIVSHLLFVDDTIIFCKAKREQVTNLSWILAWFEAASGLRINLAKSALIPVGQVDELEELAAELGCKLGVLPTVYLGLPLGAHHKTSSSWDGVEERMRRRLAQWKRIHLERGLKEEGGLGIRKIDLLNKALLGKWVWRYAYEKENLWKMVIGVKYGQEGCGWRTKEVCGPYGMGLWKEIMKEADWCWESIDFKVGKGTRVLFWTDKWCGNEALSQIFPQLFTLAGHRNAKVSEVWDSSLGQGGWNLRLARDFNDWELDQIGNMLNLLRDFKTSTEEDAVRWKREGNGVFGAKGAYKMLFGSSACAFPNRRIWMDKVKRKQISLLTIDLLRVLLVERSGEWIGSWWILPDEGVDDFNMTKFPSERSRGGKLSLAMMGFSEEARLKINGVWITKDIEIKEEVRRAFQLLLSTNSDERPNLSELSFERLEDFEVIGLEKPFMEEEVFEALSGFSRDKALGQDGFSMAFWQFS
uniref:Reverse transcriptase zinc-binding domain-containing protein n=1 Tax=Vitis vinifera TaxID=29760 RepID=A5BNN3_VITVI|nr:hypothetical protein VITISV_000043 [Vitis vinifera]